MTTNAFGINTNCPVINTSVIYSNIHAEINRLSEIGSTISDDDLVYSPVGTIRNLLLLWLNIKYDNLLLSPYDSVYNGLIYTIDDNDNVSESISDSQNNQKVYIEMNRYFQDPVKTQLGISITFVNNGRNHNSVVIIRKNGLGGYDAFHYETFGPMARDLLPNLTRTSEVIIDTSLKRMLGDITVHTTRSPTLNQAIIQQIQNKNEGGMCIALSLFVVYLSFFANVQDRSLSPGGTNITNINIECFNIPADVQLKCIRGFMKEASNEIMQRLYPLGNLASAFSITELSKYHRLEDKRIILYLDAVLKYIIDGYKKYRINLRLSSPIYGLITVEELNTLSQQNIEVEKGRILGLFITAKNSLPNAKPKAPNKKPTFTKPKKGGSTKKKKKKKKNNIKSKKRSKRR